MTGVRPPGYVDLPLLGDESTAGPSGPLSCGGRKGLGFVTQPEPPPDPHLQHSASFGLVTGDLVQYAPDGSTA